MFNVDPISGVLTASIDFEPRPAFQVVIAASDAGKPPLQTHQRIEIFMAKEFSSPSFLAGIDQDFKLNEDSPVGSIVTQVKTNENRRKFISTTENQGNEVAFAVAGGSLHKYFSVVNNTGQVLVKRTLNYETVKEGDLWIKAFHPRRPLFFSATKLNFQFMDSNDNAPAFVDSVVRAEVPEEQFPPFFVAKVWALDEDEGENAKITYKLLSKNGENDRFRVDPTTGEISCLVTLDREKEEKIDLQVSVSRFVKIVQFWLNF